MFFILGHGFETKFQLSRTQKAKIYICWTKKLIASSWIVHPHAALFISWSGHMQFVIFLKFTHTWKLKRKLTTTILHYLTNVFPPEVFKTFNLKVFFRVLKNPGASSQVPIPPSVSPHICSKNLLAFVFLAVPWSHCFIFYWDFISKKMKNYLHIKLKH